MIAQHTADVSLHAIARHAGLTAPLVKYHFGSKEGLLLALARRDTARSIEQLRALVDMDVDPERKLRIHISGIIRTYARYPYLNGLLSILLRGASSGEARDGIRTTFVQPLMDAQRAILEQGVAAGRLRPVDAGYAYAAIVGACQFFFVNDSSRARLEDAAERETEVRAYADALSEIIVSGLKAAP